jgi:hypothetical protein
VAVWRGFEIKLAHRCIYKVGSVGKLIADAGFWIFVFALRVLFCKAWVVLDYWWNWRDELGNHFFESSGLKNACHWLWDVSLGLGFHDVLEQLINHTVQLKGRCCLANCNSGSLSVSLLGQNRTKCSGAHYRLLKLRLDHMLTAYTSNSGLVLRKLKKLLHKDLVGLRCLLLLEASL